MTICYQHIPLLLVKYKQCFVTFSNKSWSDVDDKLVTNKK